MPRTSVAAVASYQETDSGIVLDCTLDRASRETLAAQQGDETSIVRTVPVAIHFYNPSTFRFSLQANPETETSDRLIDLDEGTVTRSVSVTVERRNDTLVVASSALELHIGLEEWSFSVRADGKTIFEEQRSDRDAKDQQRVDPLGFTETEISNWPYKVSETGTAFTLAADESFFGLGEQFTGFDKRGQTVEVQVTQPNGSETADAYKNVPLLYSSRGYGLFVDATDRVTFDLGDTSTLSGTVSVDDDAFEFVFFYGPSFRDILSEYTALTGRPPRPPKWSFGVWMSRYGYRTREELDAVTERLREVEMPCDVVHLDPYWMRERHECDLEWDRDAFPDPEAMIDDLHDRGFHLSLWEHPYLTVGTDAFEEARDEGYLVSDPGGDPYVLDRLSVSTYRGGIVDFTDPDAVEWWKDKHRRLLEMGVDVFKTDFGEYLPDDAVFENGRTGKAMRNAYPHLYEKAVHEAVAETVGTDEALLFARSGWFGSQRFPVHWPGDPRCTFGSMAACLRGGLSLALSGYQYWAHDVGGFKGEPSERLYIRWAQFGLLSSHTRFHGTTPREPWEFGDRALRIVREFAQLRYRLLPYLYSYAERASQTGIPLLRPLVLDYQDDPAVYDLGDQYMLGNELLVAPVFDPDGSVSVYLPDGEWIDFFSEDRYRGSQTLHMDVPIDEVPLFVRAGAIIPMRTDSTQTVPESPPEELSLLCALESEGETDATFEYFDEDAGSLEPITLQSSDGGDTVTVSVPDCASFRAELLGCVSPPETIQVDERSLDRTSEDPDPGQWTYDPDTDRVVAVFDSNRQ